MSDKASASQLQDGPLPKAKPISDGGSTSAITYLGRGKKNCGKMVVKREE